MDLTSPDGHALSAEDRYRLLAENASDIVYQTDGLHIMWISPSVTALLGYEPAELVGEPATSLISPNQDVTWVERNRLRLESGRSVHQEMLLSARDGSERWFAGHARPLMRDGRNLGGYIVGLHDIHEEVMTRRALATSERMYRAAIENAKVGIWLLDHTGNTLEVNAALCDFLGRDAVELATMSWHEVTHPEDRMSEQADMDRVLSGELDTYRRTKRYMRPDGTVRHGDLTVAAARDDDGTLVLVTKQVIDITEETESRQRLTHLATTDPLTELPNRSSMYDALNEKLSGPTGTATGVMFIDLDNFRLINESFGHAVGDATLSAVAQRIRSALPKELLLGRFGSDEFLVIVPSPCDEARLESLSASVNQSLNRGLPVHSRQISMTASIGAALAHDESTAASLLQDADVALSSAKRFGRGRFRVFNLSMASSAIRQLVLESELHEALVHDQFTTLYQPVHRMDTGARTGFEALVRWNHPREGVLSPEAFLSVAEDSGLVIDLGQVVLRRVCRDIAAHPELQEKFAVNVSAVQLDDPAWLDSVTTILDEEAIDPSRLVIELTETAVMSTRRDLSSDLQALRALDIDIHVDDFGTGYSSISLLRDLPITGLKLDRSFTASLEDRGQSGYALAEGLAGLARAIGLEGIAEGVETRGQADQLADMGWSHGQGWLFGRPETLAHWL